MSKKWIFCFFALLLAFSAQSFAAKPQNQNAAALPAPEVFSVKVDYTGGLIIVQGENLDPASATGSIAGVGLSLDSASSSSALLFPFSPEVAAAVSEMGNYVMTISTASGSFTLTAFIPFALTIPAPPPPPGPECPCSTEWDDKMATASPNGFAGQTPFCSQDSPDFVTVQYYDVPANNYWVLWTGWNGSSGYCELYIDGPNRTLSTQEQFAACAGYLRNIVTVWGNQGYDCYF